MLTFNKNGSDDLLSIKEGVAISGYTAKHIEQLCRENKIECRRVKGDWYVRKQSLLKYKATMENKSSSNDEQKKKSRIVSGFVTQVSSKLRTVGKKKKIIRLTRSPLVREQFAGKKLVRLHSAIQEGSMRATNLLSSHVTNMPTKDFWHKALSALTAIVLVFGSFYMYGSGFFGISGDVFSATAKSFMVTSGAVVKFGGEGVPRDFGEVLPNISANLSSIVRSVEENLKSGALTVRFAKEEIQSDPFLFILRAGYAWVDGATNLYNQGMHFAYAVTEGVAYSAMVGNAFR